MKAKVPRRLVHVTTVPETLSFLSGQVEYMRERGLDVHAISSPGPALEAFGRDHGIHVHAVPMTRRITPLADLISLARVLRVLVRLRPDIVHSHTPKGGLLGTLAAWLCRVPIRIYHLHGLPIETASGIRRILLRMTETLACQLASEVLCVSRSVQNKVVELGLCSNDKTKVLLEGSINGVDAERRFNPVLVSSDRRANVRSLHNIPPQAQVVGFVGRIVRDKGIVELCSAWKIVKARFPNAHLLVIGETEPTDPVPDAVLAELRRDGQVHFAGRVSDMPPYYASMDLLVLPTYREGFPTVLLEAAAMGLPIVSTRVTGPVDAVIDGLTGTLVPPYDAQALANAIEAYLVDSDRAHRHGNAARERALTQFRQEAIWAAVYEEYGRLLSGANANT